MDSKEISKTIYTVAGPTMLQMFLETSYHLVDAIWLGILGPIALASVASASFFVWMIFSAISLADVGVNSLVARYYGAKDFNSLNKIAVFGVRLGIIISFFISLIGICFIEQALSLMGLEADVVSNGTLFLTPIFIGLTIISVSQINLATFRGMGDTKTPLKILILTILLNAILAPLFIFGISIFPEMGVAGASFATLISQIVCLLLSTYILKKRGYLKREKKLMDLKVIMEIAKIGSPLAFNGVIFCIVYLFIAKVVSQFGTASIAALGIGHRVESMAYCISLGFSIAATTLVGQNVGAKNEKKARKIAWTINYYAGAIILFISILILIFKESIAGIFTTDKEVINSTAQYLTAIGFTEVFLAFEIVMEGVFSGFGNTLPPTVIGLPLNILRIPIAYFLSSFLGVMGVWIAIGATTALKGFLLIIWFALQGRKTTLRSFV